MTLSLNYNNNIYRVTSINSFGDLLIQDYFDDIMEIEDFFNHYKENFKIELLAQGC